jgi:hypothetical protein
MTMRCLRATTRCTFGDDDEHENRRKCTLCKKGTRGVIVQYVRTLPRRHVHNRSCKEGANASRIGVVGVKQVALLALGGVIARFVRRGFLSLFLWRGEGAT